MFKIIIKTIILLLPALFLTACSGFFDKDNTPTPTPLEHFKSEINPRLLWSVRTEASEKSEYLKTGPALTSAAIFTASTQGTVTSINKMNGRINWQVSTHVPLSTTPAAEAELVVVASRKGDVIALQQSDGRTRWKTSVLDEILAQPVIRNGTVIIKAVDGHVRALSAQDGHELWTIQQAEPALILHGSSAPVIDGRHIIVGFANGNLAKFSLNQGQLEWQQRITIPEGAFAIQRMIDIDADPIVFDHHLYAATYQGKIASLNLGTGQIIWSHDISSYTGMTADNSSVYISDASGYVWSFHSASGSVNWRQTKLEARVISGPALMGQYLVVGDAEGYLHWLDKQDGHFVARLFAGTHLYAAPVADDHVLYVLSSEGRLSAYTITS